jgi:predicted PhzF superfamily epimerase YddE/YHI9
VSQSFHVVDAFADRPFSGNPAAVYVLDGPADEAWMRLVAREMNLSETAFLHPEPVEGEAGYRLRWFTPTVEVDLCGHATLASSHVLWETGRLRPGQPARFITRSGPLAARQIDGPGVGQRLIELDFPARPVRPVPAPPELGAALGARVVAGFRFRDDWLVELEDEVAVRSLSPSMAAIAALDARGVVVTARAALPPHDFVSRFFAPAQGLPEDPVTGAAHCMLAPFWTERLGRAGTTLVGYQASERGGVVRVRGDRVELGGQAVTVSRGELLHSAGAPGIA